MDKLMPSGALGDKILARTDETKRVRLDAEKKSVSRQEKIIPSNPGGPPPEGRKENKSG